MRPSSALSGVDALIRQHSRLMRTAVASTVTGRAGQNGGPQALLARSAVKWGLPGQRFQHVTEADLDGLIAEHDYGVAIML